MVIIGGGGHGLATAYYLARDHGVTQCGRAGTRLARRRQHRAQHRDHPLQLPDAGGRALLRRVGEAVSGPLGRLRPQHPLLRPAATSPSPTPTPRSAPRAGGRRSTSIWASIPSLVWPDDIKRLCPELNLSDEVRYPILAALYHPPGSIARHDAVAWGYARGAARRGVEIHTQTEVTGIRIENGRAVGRRDQPRLRQGRPRSPGRRRQQLGGGTHGRPAAADPHHPAAGLRQRALQADPGPDHRLGLAARLHLAVRARRVRHGRLDRPLHALPHAAARSTSRKA